MSTDFVGKVPTALVEFVLKKLIRAKHFKYNRVNPPKKWKRMDVEVARAINKEELVKEQDNRFNVAVDIIDSDIIKVHYFKNKQSDSWAVGEQNLKSSKLTEERVFEDDRALKDEKGTFEVRVRTDGQLSIIKQDLGFEWDTIIFQSEDEEWLKLNRFSSHDDEHYFGLGETTGQMERKNTTTSFWNTDSLPYDNTSENLYQTQPLLLIVRETVEFIAVIFDKPQKAQININEQKEKFVTEYFIKDQELIYYFISSTSLEGLYQKISKLLGVSPFPPLSVLGHHQCRWSYYPEKEVLDLAETFRKKRIPCDYIHLDIDYMDNYKVFTWNREHFPNPKQLSDKLAQQGFKLIAMTDPGIKVEAGYTLYEEGIKDGHFCLNPDESLFVGKVWPGDCHFPDFTQEKTQKWFGKHFSALIEAGIKGFWIDMNDPSVFNRIGTMPDDVIHPNEGKKLAHKDIHNLYGHLMAKAAYEGLKELMPNERVFVLTRSTYLGTQKYSGSWTGDNTANWEHLRMCFPMLINMAVSGQVMIGPDIGGFLGKPSAELVTRWYQAGLFYPFYRNHSINKNCAHEPWVYGLETEERIKQAIKLRYKLLLYIYNEIRKSCEQGTPVLKPLWYYNVEDFMCFDSKWLNNQCLFGENFLLAPVLTKGAKETSFYLPSGDWYDIEGKHYEGNSTYSIPVTLDSIPLFVKAGSIIPIIEDDVQNTEELLTSPITLLIFPANDMKGEIYLDDGRSLEYQEGEYEKITITGKKEEDCITLTLNHEGRKNKFIKIKEYKIATNDKFKLELIEN